MLQIYQNLVLSLENNKEQNFESLKEISMTIFQVIY